MAKRKEEIKKHTGSYLDNLNNQVEAREKDIDNECDSELREAMGDFEREE